MRAIATACFFLLAPAVCGQPAPLPRLEFEVENVKLNLSGASAHSSDVSRSGQVFFRNTTIAELLPLAFQRKTNLIVGSPAWFESDRFDIAAKATPDISERSLGLMVQSLLAREFRLAFHEEQRPMDAFALVTAGGAPKLRKVPGPGFPGCVRGGTIERQEADCASITMTNLMSFLSFVAQDYIDRPVIDRTGMPGTYEFKLTWTPQRFIETNGGLTIFDAITKQLGLKLEQRKLPVSVTVIDHAERLAEN